MARSSMRLRTISRVLLPGVVVASGVLVAAAPAAAAVPGLVRVSATSANNSNDFRSVTATCPAGKNLIGTGYQINGATGEAVVDNLLPNGSATTAPTAVTVAAYEADSFAGNWSVTVYATCADPIAGLVRVSASSASNSNDFRSATATCPTGKTMVGTGYQINGATGEATVDELRPNGSTTSAPTSVTVGVYEGDSFAGNWSVSAFAICADPLSGLVRVSTTGASNSNDFHSATATCPAGKRLTGTGFGTLGATGDAVADDLRPNGGTTSAPTAVTVGSYEGDAIAGNWRVTAYGICANA
ncbi:MAG TPA: hypothetical protein VFO77_12630 [Actinoplanes sp.]|nr:hypothetical protein [Actinoplanes sp.]